MTTSKRLIEVKSLYKIYKTGDSEVRALDNVSLTVNSGEFAAVIGHSGSGKSTFMNIIGCLDTPTSGEYCLDGVNVSSLNDDRLSAVRNRQIGFVFQGFNLISSLNALENVELPLMYRGVPKKERIELSKAALSKVGLADRLTHFPSQMSGGQQQRVAIARAIAAKPPIILADEPTGNLDSKSGGEVMDILLELWKDGRTIILITHDTEIAKSAQRIIKITDGKIVIDKYRL